MSRTPILMAAIAVAATPVVAADDSGAYLGAGVGAVDGADQPSLGVPNVPLLAGSADDEIGWGVNVGYRFSQNLAIELGYVDLGELRADFVDAAGASDARASAGFSADGVTLALVGVLPVGKWEPYLKAGILFASTVLAYSGAFAGSDFGARLSNDSEDALYGIGVKYQVRERLQLYLDSTYFMEVGEPGTGESDYLNTSAGVTWQF